MKSINANAPPGSRSRPASFLSRAPLGLSGRGGHRGASLSRACAAAPGARGRGSAGAAAATAIAPRGREGGRRGWAAGGRAGGGHRKGAEKGRAGVPRVGGGEGWGAGERPGARWRRPGPGRPRARARAGSGLRIGAGPPSLHPPGPAPGRQPPRPPGRPESPPLSPREPRALGAPPAWRGNLKGRLGTLGHLHQVGPGGSGRQRAAGRWGAAWIPIGSPRLGPLVRRALLPHARPPLPQA